jgi:hypothetical protein
MERNEMDNTIPNQHTLENSTLKPNKDPRYKRRRPENELKLGHAKIFAFNAILKFTFAL